jgi:hypothetical protein
MNRREFFKAIGAGLAGLAALPLVDKLKQEHEFYSLPWKYYGKLGALSAIENNALDNLHSQWVDEQLQHKDALLNYSSIRNFELGQIEGLYLSRRTDV